MTLRDELAHLRTENAARAAQVARLQQQLAAALARIAELERQRPDPPPFVKPNRSRPDEPGRPRTKRAAQQNRGRRCELPTRTEPHALDPCPDCHYPLRGSSIDYRRQVIELPPPQPVEVIEHQVIQRWCPACQRWHSPKLDLRGQVFGQGRIGVRGASLIAFWSLVRRVPVRRIQAYLRTLHQLRLSTGASVDLLHEARRTLQPQVDQLKQQARASPILHGDETGWRENGQNGYIWAFSTPGEDAVRYYEYDPGRGQHVVRRILGGQCDGHLVSDCYGGYNRYAGKRQRCRVHLLRDLHALKEAHAADEVVLTWAAEVRALSDAARRWLHEPPQPTPEAREQQSVALTAQAHRLGLAHARAKKHPCRALARRLLRHEDELFQFVLVEGLSPDHNLAERSLRPLVVIRKISGGSRSPEGTKTRKALASVFATWQARRLNPFDTCLRLLSQAAAS